MACATPLAPPPVVAPSPTSARAQVLALAARKAGSPLKFPLLAPEQSPWQWLESQRTQVGNDSPSQFRFVGETLLLAQSLLSQKEDSRRRAGLSVASECANFVAAHLGDEKELLAGIYRGFILPNVSLAGVRPWDSPSRQRLLEASVSAFKNAGMNDAQKSVLEWLLQIGASQSKTDAASGVSLDVNTMDWARATLAVLLIQPADAPRADLERAYALLRGLDDDPKAGSIKGFLHIREQLKKRLQELPPTTKKPSP